jgi:endonuclease G, mitochondrial
MEKKTKLIYLLIFLLFYVIAGPITNAIGQTVEQRLARLEARVDSFSLLIKPPLDTAGSAQILKSNQNLQWGIAGPKGTILDKEFFIINHNDGWKIPYWVAYYASQQLLEGDTKRTQDFRPDLQLPPGNRSELEDYRNSGYDRGHNAPAADFQRSKAAMSTTFLLSNMSPQTPKLNERIWEKLESEVRQSIEDEGEGWVITGSLFLSPDSHFITPSIFIGPDRVAVPTHCFKAICLKGKNNQYYIYSFLMPNQRENIPGQPIDYQITTDRLEVITGYDFFPLLPDSLESELESKIQNVWPR